MDKYLFKYLLRILGIYVEMELLRHTIIFCLIFGRSINVLLKSHLRGKIELQILKVKWVNMHCWPPFLSWGIVDVQYYINFRYTIFLSLLSIFLWLWNDTGRVFVPEKFTFLKGKVDIHTMWFLLHTSIGWMCKSQVQRAVRNSGESPAFGGKRKKGHWIRNRREESEIRASLRELLDISQNTPENALEC